MLSLLDVLVDGRFVEELRDISLRFRGSSNQRLIDLNASRAAGHLCFLPDRPRGGPMNRVFRSPPPQAAGIFSQGPPGAVPCAAMSKTRAAAPGNFVRILS